MERQNAATWDRIVRAFAGMTMLGVGIFAPFPLLVRVLALGGTGLYLLGTAVVGTCLGYKLMGISTCPIEERNRAA